MTVSILFKIAAVGILITVLNQVLKHSGRGEDQAFLCSLAGLVLVLMWLIPYIYDLFAMMQELFLIG
jgi:stage III sporulation protein AC